MTGGKGSSDKIVGLSAPALEKAEAVSKLLAQKDFIESSQELAKRYFDNAWSVDPESESELGPTPLDVTPHRDT